MNKQFKVRMDISYEGTYFKGYQIQKTARTVQGEIEKVLQKIYKERIKTVAAGRTDTGVHAIHQVVSFNIKKQIPADGLKRALNSMLPWDIRALDVSYEDEKFHARFSPYRRNYMFVIYNADNILPFQKHYCWWVRRKINFRKLKKVLKQYRGTHDFTSFSEKPENKNRLRAIDKIKAKKKGDYIYIYIRGNAFLRRMVRIMTGTAVGIALHPDYKPAMIQEIINKKDRGKNPFPTAEPQGLYFYKVEFKKSKIKAKK